MLRDLTVQNYRCFEDFYIDGLERVNLFVGNNNSGKTSLLEAIYLLSSTDKSEALLETIDNRTDYFLTDNTFFYSVRHLFYGHYLKEKAKAIISSQNGIPRHLILEFSNSKRGKHYPNLSLPYLSCYEQQKMKLLREEELEGFVTLSNRSSLINLENGEYIKVDRHQEKGKYIQIEKKISNCVLVSVNKLFFEKVALMWDTIILTSKENKIVEALKILDRNLERISFSSSSNPNLIRLKLKNLETPIPLSSMGEGMYRILTLAMSLVTAEDGVLLVDEIETGLHYEAQTDMWRLILETAKELNVQVFATTHSWDCIAAYQEALSQVEDLSMGKLFRLDSKYGKLRAVEYDAEDLEVVTREGIEVR